MSKPPPKFGEILVIWGGGLDKGFYGIEEMKQEYSNLEKDKACLLFNFFHSFLMPRLSIRWRRCICSCNLVDIRRQSSNLRDTIKEIEERLFKTRINMIKTKDKQNKFDLTFINLVSLKNQQRCARQCRRWLKNRKKRKNKIVTLSAQIEVSQKQYQPIINENKALKEQNELLKQTFENYKKESENMINFKNVKSLFVYLYFLIIFLN